MRKRIRLIPRMMKRRKRGKKGIVMIQQLEQSP